MQKLLPDALNFAKMRSIYMGVIQMSLKQTGAAKNGRMIAFKSTMARRKIEL